MHERFRVHCIAACAFFLTSGAWSKGSAKPANDRSRDWTSATARVLEMRGDRRSRLAAAAVLASTAVPDSPPTAKALQLMEPGAAGLSENRTLDAIRMRICEQTSACDALGMSATMRWLDADNAATWLPNLANAYEDQDELQTDRVLVDMAQGKRFFLYVDAAGALMLDAMIAANAPASNGRSGAVWDYASDVISIYTPFFIPSPVPVLKMCSVPAPTPQRRDSCLKVAALLQQGDSVVFQVFGLLIQRHFALADPRTVRLLNDRRRILDWRQQKFAKLMHPFLPWSRKRVALKYAEALHQYPRQEDLITALLRAYHVALEPPSPTPPKGLGADPAATRQIPTI